MRYGLFSFIILYCYFFGIMHIHTKNDRMVEKNIVDMINQLEVSKPLNRLDLFSFSSFDPQGISPAGI